MSSPIDDDANGLNPVVGGTVRHLVISSAKTVPSNQSAFTSDSATNETENLLDFDGLLEMARVISGVKEDGRLGSVNQESSKLVVLQE